ncbi:MAG TPA: gluconokinase [Blastocatellia bacterium]|nr:gluconokinase [Blastocatellia bacterium]
MSVISFQEARPPLIIALDLGTSSARALLFDGRGRNVPGLEAQVPYRMTTTPDGGVEIDADRLVDIVAQTIDQLLTLVGASRETLHPIAAVAACTFWHNLMGVDREGLAVTPVYSWNDTRAAAAARELRNTIDERELHARTGCVLHASYWPAKLTWLRGSQPDLFNRVHRWMSVGEYLYLRLFGRTVCSISMASATGIFNQNECDWDRDTLSSVGIALDQLSLLGDMEAAVSGLSSGYSARWPTLASIPWFPALGDGACGNVGSGCVTSDRAALNLGTSGALRVAWTANEVKIPGGLWCYRVDRRRFVMGGALSNGGDLFGWLQETLRLGTVEEVEAELDRLSADEHGLTVLPFLSGERSTGWHSEARAAIIGLSLDTTPLEILRAGLESVAYRFAAIYDLIAREIERPSKVIASGAAVLRSPAWAQIISDVIGAGIFTSAEAEISSRGAALMGLEALGVSSIDSVEIALGRAFSPDSERHRRYQDARERQGRLYEAIIVKGAINEQ